MTKHRWLPLALLILLSLIWGTSFILIKQGLKAFDPDVVGALRVSAAALFMLPVALYKLRNLTPSHYGRLFLSGLMGILIPSFLFAFAQTRLESAVTGIGNSLTPIFTLIIGAVLFRQQFHRSALLGILVGLAGTVLLILSRTGESISGINAYSLLIIVACLFYATNVNFIKYRIADVPSMTITSVSILLIGPFAMGYLFGATNFLQTMSATPGAWRSFGFVVLLGLMSTAIATIVFNRLVKLSTPLFTSSVTYLIPLVAVMWGVLDGERLMLNHYLGMVAIVGGVYLTNMRKAPALSSAKSYAHQNR
ncbi:MAG TPA: DMT family transporter [Cyclobacteriaceae bacterium]|jgi:drug/metabolite transporter (DMT)-like permease